MSRPGRQPVRFLTKAGGRTNGRNFLRPLVLLAPLLLAACSGSSNGDPEIVTTSVSSVETVLEDVTEQLPDRRIRWRTYWRLCWKPYPGATAYELQALTSEGFSTQLRRQTERCFRIEAAAGENDRSQGFVNRDLWLQLQSAQLSYRVRAVLDRNRFSNWSPAMAVGIQSAQTPLQTE